MDGKEVRYIFPSTLSNQRRWMGLPVDEFCVYFPLAGGAVFSSLYIYAPMLIIAIIVIKRLKRGRGSSYLINLMYWFLPKSLSDFFIRALPASHLRYWIS